MKDFMQITNAGCDIHPHATVWIEGSDGKFISGNKKIGRPFPLSWSTPLDEEPKIFIDGAGYGHLNEETIFCKTTFPGGCTLNKARQYGYFFDNTRTGKITEEEYAEVEKYISEHGLKLEKGMLIMADEYVTYTNNVAKIKK